MGIDLKELLENFETTFEQIEEGFKQKRKEITSRMRELEEQDMFSRFDSEYVAAFFKRPYVTLPRKEEEWYLVVPKFFDLNVGYLTKSTDSYNVFIVNKYADYLGAVPEEFRQVFKFKPKIPLKMFDGMLLTGDEHQAVAWERYSPYLQRREGTDKIRVKKGKEFLLIAQLIADGILPFIPKPVEKSHLIEGEWKTRIDEMERRRHMPFFTDAFQRFLETGAVGIYWAMGVGKTIFGLEALSRVRVDNLPNLVISGTSATIRAQWERNLQLIVPAARVEVQTFQSWHKVKDKKYGLVVFDEHHALLADNYSKLVTIDTQYRIGLSGTPYREDGRTDLIFASSGFPVGLDWRVLIDLDLIKEPPVTLILCGSYAQKRQKLKELLQDAQKTLIYCYSLDMGKSLSRDFEIPFVHGSTPVKERLPIIRSSQTTIVSSVGGEGLSIQDIERTISYNFLFGSRREEAQFFGRLLHGEETGHHIILMTDEEYDKYGKRLYGIQEKGFKIRVTRAGGGGSTSSRPTPRKARSPPRTVTPSPRPDAPVKREAPVIDTSSFPMLDERDKFEKHGDRIIRTILSSSYAREKGGLSIAEIRAILDFRHIKYGKYDQLRQVVRRLFEGRKISGARDSNKRRYWLEGE